LRTPLTSISAALGLATGGALGELNSSQLRMLQLAQTNCQQLTTLVNTLLDVEKLASGNMQFQLSVQPLLPLLQQCIDDCQILTQPQQITLTLACPPELQQAQVQADASRLKQVLLHLLGNAVKFSPPNSTVQVSVQLRQHQLRVIIADQGVGISEQFVPKLFSRFSQADSSDSRMHGGSGLGLAVSKSIIGHMCGSIGYMPNKPQGSCFYLELPFDASIQPGQLP
jgi:two-component system sensor histidine kinase VicK